MTFTPGPAADGQPSAAPTTGARPALPLAANDNATDLTRDGLLRAALRHFAEHGLGAAELAQQRAEKAFFAGNRKEYRHWLDICRALDRRLAASCAAQRNSGP
jgi:hypothetical protein